MEIENKLKNEDLSEENKARRDLLKKAYKVPLIVSLGATGSPLNAGISDLPPPPPITGASASSEPLSFDPFPSN